MTAKKMKETTPAERSRCIMKTADFLKRLVDPKETARVPKEVREEAEKLLKHFPVWIDITLSNKHAPFLWGDLPRPTGLVSEWEL